MSSLHTSDIDVSTFVDSSDAIHTGQVWASSSTVDPWDPAILTLDGGGIRGYSSLLIIKQLMHEIAIWEKKFDQLEAEAGTTTAPMTTIVTDTVTNDHIITTDPPGMVESIQSLEARPIDSRASSPKPSLRLTVPPVVREQPKGDLIVPQTMGTLAEAPPGEFEDNLLPCHYFDYMYGTSTGGLIATMLGRLRMSVGQCLAIYREVGEQLFGKQRSSVPLKTKYHHEPLEQAVRAIVRRYCKQHPAVGECPGDDMHPWGVGGEDTEGRFTHVCQSICLTAVHNGKIDEAHLLRTYDHQYRDVAACVTPYNTGADKLRIWEVTRATSAAPFYFDSLEAVVDGEKWIFKDGGIRQNNPAGAAWSEFISLYGDGKDPALLLSVGTGRPDETQDGFAATWPGPFGKLSLMKKAAEKFAVLKNALVKYTAGEEKHRAMVMTARGEHEWYKRVNVDRLGIPLDEWKSGKWKDPKTGEETVIPGGETLSKMEETTRAYLLRERDQRVDGYAGPRTKLVQAAEKLVRQRRARVASSDETRKASYFGRHLAYNQAEDDGTIEVPIEHTI